MTEHDEMEPSENGAIEENLTSDDNYTIVSKNQKRAEIRFILCPKH